MMGFRRRRTAAATPVVEIKKEFTKGREIAEEEDSKNPKQPPKRERFRRSYFIEPKTIIQTQEIITKEVINFPEQEKKTKYSFRRRNEAKNEEKNEEKQPSNSVSENTPSRKSYKSDYSKKINDEKNDDEKSKSSKDLNENTEKKQTTFKFGKNKGTTREEKTTKKYEKENDNIKKEEIIISKTTIITTKTEEKNENKENSTTPTRSYGYAKNYGYRRKYGKNNDDKSNDQTPKRSDDDKKSEKTLSPKIIEKKNEDIPKPKPRFSYQYQFRNFNRFKNKNENEEKEEKKPENKVKENVVEEVKVQKEETPNNETEIVITKSPEEDIKDKKQITVSYMMHKYGSNKTDEDLPKKVNKSSNLSEESNNVNIRRTFISDYIPVFSSERPTVKKSGYRFKYTFKREPIKEERIETDTSEVNNNENKLVEEVPQVKDENK